MTTTVNLTIGTSSRNYSTISAWWAAIPSDLTRTATSTCGSGSTTSAVVLNAGASGTDGYYTGLVLTISGESRLITNYVGATKTATVGALNGSSATFSSAPASGTSYTVDSVAYVGQCYNDSEFSESVVMSGKTTSATCNITLTAAAGQSFIDNANVQTNALRYNQSNGVALKCTIAYQRVLQIATNYVTVSRMQMKQAAGGQSGVFLLNASNITLTQCILVGDTGHDLMWIYYGPNATITNCLLYCGAYRVNNMVYSLGISGGMVMANCTVATSSNLSASGVGLYEPSSSNASTARVVNTCFFNCTTPISGSTPNVSNYNATDAASLVGTNSIVNVSYTGAFQGTTSSALDFRLKSGSGLIDVGTTDTTDIPSAIDIVGTSRPQGSAWDVGCWEYVVASVTVSVIRINF